MGFQENQAPPQQAMGPNLMMNLPAPVPGVPVTVVMPPAEMTPMLEQYRELSNQVGQGQAMQVRGASAVRQAAAKAEAGADVDTRSVASQCIWSA